MFGTFYFQIREPLTPLNIPTPTPASDRGGPVDRCIRLLTGAVRWSVIKGQKREIDPETL